MMMADDDDDIEDDDLEDEAEVKLLNFLTFNFLSSPPACRTSGASKNRD